MPKSHTSDLLAYTFIFLGGLRLYLKFQPRSSQQKLLIVAQMTLICSMYPKGKPPTVYKGHIVITA